MVYEDFLTYVEYDPYGQILVWSNYISFTSPMYWDGWVYKDKGIGYFWEKWESKVDIKVMEGGVESLGAWATVWGLANLIDDFWGIYNAGGSELCVGMYRSNIDPYNYSIILREVFGGSHQDAQYVISNSTWYYLTLKRDYTTLTCEIYSDSARTILLTTLNLTLNTSQPSHRYIYAAQTYNSGGSQVLAAYIQNLELFVLPPPLPPICPENPYVLYINSVPRNYIKVHYVKKHPDPDPDTFDVTVNYDVGELVNYFDSVEVRKKEITEFYGFVEDINPQKGIDGLEYVITGRCWKLLLWKKFTERFQESREIGPEDLEGNKETGFFGSVYPQELFRFLLRCPISEHPKGKVRHKIGWGIPSDFWKCCANVTADTFYPDWVGLRYTDLSWRGRASTANLHYTNLVCDGFDSTWSDFNEEGNSPYLHTDSDADQIWLNAGHPYPAIPPHQEGWFTFPDMPVGASTIYNAILHVKASLFGFKVAVYLDNGTSTYKLGYLNDSGSYNYIYTDFNLNTICTTVGEINNAKIYFLHDSSPYGSVHIIYSYLEIEYSTTTDPDINQKADDWFVVNLGAEYDLVTAMLIECRNKPNMYARNYKIQYCTISDCCAEGGNDGFWSDFDDDGSPINVVNNVARDILHSWKPQDNVRGIRIKLTADADPPWEISQIYVWRADELKYRLLNET